MTRSSSVKLRLALSWLASLAVGLPCPAWDQPPTPATDQAAFNTVCGACHAASSVSGLRTEAEWRETVEHMISIGAHGTDEQFDAVMRVLERNLTKVNVNAASAAEIAPVLDVSEEQAQAIVKYRAEHGAFKTPDDLKRVPGLPASKVDARNNRLVF
jgi:competence protein ComEA